MAASGLDAADASTAEFGPEMKDATFISNAAMAVLLTKLKEKMKESGDSRPSLAFERSLEYATRFCGAVQPVAEAVDAVLASLMAWEVPRPRDDGTEERIKLKEYECTTLVNLNPSTALAARSLLPSLERFTDEEVEELLRILRQASAQYAGLDRVEGAAAGAAGGGAGVGFF